MINWVTKLFKNGNFKQSDKSGVTRRSAESAGIKPETHVCTIAPPTASASNSTLKPPGKASVEAPRIVRYSHWWRVKAAEESWLTSQTFYVYEQAKLAIEIYNRGGTEEEFRAARLNLSKAKEMQSKSDDIPKKGGPNYSKAEKKELKRLQSLVCGKERHNSELCFELATRMLRGYRRYSSIRTKDGLSIWQQGIRVSIRVDNKQVVRLINRAIALGLTSELDAAKARFIATELLLSGLTVWPPEKLEPAHRVELSPRDYRYDLLSAYGVSTSLGWEGSPRAEVAAQARLTSRVQALVKQMIRCGRRFLSRDPGNIEALYIVRAGYEFLDNKVKLGETEQEIVESKSLGRKLFKVQEMKPESVKSSRKRNDGRTLEMQVKVLLEELGFQARMTQPTADGGIDVEAFSEHPIYGGKFVVQCKDWTKSQVGEPTVRELYGVVMAEAAVKGILITTGQFTQAAKRFARGKQLELIDGEAFKRLLLQSKRNK